MDHPTISYGYYHYCHEGSISTPDGTYEVFRHDSYRGTTTADSDRVLIPRSFDYVNSATSRERCKAAVGGTKFTVCKDCREYWID
jgi:hypothetical protein